MSLSLLFAALVAGAAAAQPPPDPVSPPQLSAHAVESGTVALDGRLDEAAWGAATVASGFTQRGPNPGAPGTEPTEARVLYDGGAIYVGMRMHDSEPSKILAPLGRRDADLSSDWAFVGLDSYGDKRTAFVFGVNPAGVQRDMIIFDDVREDMSWDAVWDVAVSRDSAGWTAEFRIPLGQLRYAAVAGEQTWGVQFGRDLQRTGETVFWAPLRPEDNGMVSLFGTLGGLRDLKAPRRLEIRPYVAAALTRAPGNAADPFYSANEAEPRVGLDVKYGLTSDLTLTATVNPDFGQVEADPAQVNLGGFELFLQERRPFFVEGADIFQFGNTRAFFRSNRPSFLYTRRIGRSPQRSSFVPGSAYGAAGQNGTVYADAPQQTTILGATKLSGRVGRFSVGVLDAVTAPEHGRYIAVDGAGNAVVDDRALVEPLTNYFVGRARTTVGKTILGGVVTATNRDMSDPAFPDLLPSQGYVLGLDFERPLSEDWVVSGVLAGSRLAGTPTAIASVQTAFPRLYQRPDADYLDLDPTRTSLDGLSGEVALTKAGGEHWVGSISGAFTTPGFDANSLGYQSRADHAYVGGVLVYNQNKPQGPFRRWSANGFGGLGSNFGGDVTMSFVGGNVNLAFQNFWNANLNWTVGPRTLSDRLTRGGPIATTPAFYSLNVNGSTDSRKPVSAYVWTGHVRNEIGGRQNGVEAGVEVRPSASVSVSLGPGFDLSRTLNQYVTSVASPQAAQTFGRRYLFGDLDQAVVSMTARVNWTFRPNLSLQVYARPFATRGRYAGFSELGAPRSLDFPVYGADAGTIETGRFATGADGRRQFVADPSVAEAYRLTPADGGAPVELSNPSFTYRALQGNAVLRWEYRPGSTVFLVWQQQRTGFATDGALDFGRDVRGLFADPLTNVFLVKLSYWLG